MSDPEATFGAFLVVLLAAALAWQGLHERRTRTRRGRRVDYGRDPVIPATPAVWVERCQQCPRPATTAIRAGFTNWPVCGKCHDEREVS